MTEAGGEGGVEIYQKMNAKQFKEKLGKIKICAWQKEILNKRLLVALK